METIYLIMTNMKVEFKNLKNEFLEWDEKPTPLYAFKSSEEAKKEIQKLRQDETERYKEWLKDEENQNCFLHHQLTLKEIIVFEKQLPY